MAKPRLIPKLQLKTASYDPKKMIVVITKNFSETIEIGDAVSQAKIFQDQAADELVFVNIDKNEKSIYRLAGIINKASQEIFMPMTVGGGVLQEEDFRVLLANGADKISINTIALLNPSFVTSVARKFGAQCVVISIDYKKNEAGEYKVYTEGGTKETKWNPVDWAVEAEKLGAGEILLCSITHDGMRHGLDLNITRQVADAISIPVITSGGCGLALHFSEGFIKGKADAVAAGSFFAHRDQNLMQTRSQIKNAGVNIRVHT